VIYHVPAGVIGSLFDNIYSNPMFISISVTFVCALGCMCVPYTIYMYVCTVYSVFVCMYYVTIITRAVEHESLQLKRDNDTIVKRIKQLVR
jgi:hypothetical protein